MTREGRVAKKKHKRGSKRWNQQLNGTCTIKVPNKKWLFVPPAPLNTCSSSLYSLIRAARCRHVRKFIHFTQITSRQTHVDF